MVKVGFWDDKVGFLEENGEFWEEKVELFEDFPLGTGFSVFIGRTEGEEEDEITEEDEGYEWEEVEEDDEKEDVEEFEGDVNNEEDGVEGMSLKVVVMGREGEEEEEDCGRVKLIKADDEEDDCDVEDEEENVVEELKEGEDI